MTINERISEILASNKELTQKNMAGFIGVASSTVNNWLKLGRSIPSEFIIPISEYLRIDSHYLLTGVQSINAYNINSEDNEWLSLIHQLPTKAQHEFRGEIKGYLKRLNEESIAVDEPLKKTGTTNLAK